MIGDDACDDSGGGGEGDVACFFIGKTLAETVVIQDRASLGDNACLQLGESAATSVFVGNDACPVASPCDLYDGGGALNCPVFAAAAACSII
jgi:hypothetical protein